jgi:hypothetical protein
MLKTTVSGFCSKGIFVGRMFLLVSLCRIRGLSTYGIQHGNLLVSNSRSS